VLTRGQIRAQREAHDWLDQATGRQFLLDRTRQGEEVADFLVQVMRGARFRWPQLHPKEDVTFRPTPEQRVRAALAIAERLWGRPPQNEGAAPAQVVGAGQPPLSEEDAAQLRAAYLAMTERSPGETDDGGSAADGDH